MANQQPVNESCNVQVELQDENSSQVQFPKYVNYRMKIGKQVSLITLNKRDAGNMKERVCSEVSTMQNKAEEEQRKIDKEREHENSQVSGRFRPWNNITWEDAKIT